MNTNEMKCFTREELKLYDTTSLPLKYLLKSLFVKFRRKTWGRYRDRKSRFVWTVSAVTDAIGPASTVCDYLERRTIRSQLASIKGKYPISTGCEVGCGYGRLIMVLQEFFTKVVGFERQKHLIDIARTLLPAINFCEVASLDQLNSFYKVAFDFAMTCTVLQHLTDDFCQRVLEEMKRLSPRGHILLIEKIENILTTPNIDDGDSFISRARSVDTYVRWMRPYKLISVSKRIVEPSYRNPDPGSVMLFRSPLLDSKKGNS